ncbi:MAG: signal peptidase I [Candidatus Latescibacteria bacterium]|nr:signal peptidase I [Candidatus Latescibacterota bacterium]
MVVNMKKHAEEKVKPQYTGFMKFRKEWIEPVLTAFVCVFIFKMFFFQNYAIPSGSMEDTLLEGDRLFASKFFYGTKIPFTETFLWRLNDPKPGDIIIFRSPAEPKLDLIKRCVAVGGQIVEIRNKEVYVDGELQQLPQTGKHIDSHVFPGRMNTRDNIAPFKVTEGMLFMMGDNRDNSNDSRFWGLLPEENIKGKALFLYWSVDKHIPVFGKDASASNLVRRIRWNRMLDKIQ